MAHGNVKTCRNVNNCTYFQSLRSGQTLFGQLSKTLRLSKLQEVAFGLALLNSTKQSTQEAAFEFLKLRFNSLLVSYSSAGEDITQSDYYMCKESLT